MTLIVGIDPGLTGACAVLGTDGRCADLFDLPVARDAKRSWIDGGVLRAALANWKSDHHLQAYVEGVHAMPKQGVSSAFQFGMGVGSIVGCLQAMIIPIAFVPPTQWKKALGLPREKDAALDRARLLFPEQDLRLKKHDGRAEALLIAHWAYLKYRKDPHQ